MMTAQLMGKDSTNTQILKSSANDLSNNFK